MGDDATQRVLDPSDQDPRFWAHFARIHRCDERRTRRSQSPSRPQRPLHHHLPAESVRLRTGF